MNIKETIDKERWEPLNPAHIKVHNDSIDRIEAAVTGRIKALENSVELYEQLLDKAYDEFLKCTDNWEVREVLKGLVAYAPRKNWEGKCL